MMMFEEWSVTGQIRQSFTYLLMGFWSLFQEQGEEVM
jgi:hypothetical protein